MVDGVNLACLVRPSGFDRCILVVSDREYRDDGEWASEPYCKKKRYALLLDARLRGKAGGFCRSVRQIA